MSLPGSYFDDMYQSADDPWSFRERWYERRKRDLTIACLPRRHYSRAFEVGCSIGLVTNELAGRCDSLLAVDASDVAVRQAEQAVGAYSHVLVERRMLPAEWPTANELFDLVVLSEVGYYFDAADLAVLLDRVVSSLQPGGTLVACHWRHPVAEYPLPGDTVHEAIEQRPELFRSVRHEEADFLLDVFTLGTQLSVAQREELV